MSNKFTPQYVVLMNSNHKFDTAQKPQLRSC